MTIVAGARKGFPLTDLEIELLRQVALFSGFGMLVSLLFMDYGIDLGPGFF
jgi:hypothetical protein